ncbi:acyltransferase [Propionimicrobium lymphophilum]|uniref:acyltransferase n=1 Tax=Propionimicrobium lymphophilum TaxID=33012 RepID=UPI0023F3BC6E|nr:acyltransferase family protein [Propionimicrobium lymphophilum]
MIKNTHRRVWMDVLNVVGIFLVVFLHSRTAYFSNQPVNGYWIEYLISGIGVAAVPLFFAISGANLIGFTRKMSIRDFFKKRFSKIIIPYFIWGIAGALYQFFCLDNKKIFENPISLLCNLQQANAPLWFLMVLAGIYVLMPLFSAAITAIENRPEDPTKFYYYLIAICYIGGVIMPLVRSFIPGFLPQVDIVPGSEYVLFPIMGYVLLKIDLKKWQRTAIYSLGFIGFLSFSVLGAFTSLKGWGHQELLTSYFGVGVPFITAAFFVLAKQINFQRFDTRLHTALANLSKLTFGIYLIHIIPSDAFRRIVGYNGFRSDLLVCLVTWAFCVATVWVLRKIPVVKRWALP